MQRKKKATNFLPKVVFPGGRTGFKQFVTDNLNYPKAALKMKTEGVVRIKIDIDYKGSVVGTQILKSVGDGCDEEAIRLAKKMQWQVDKKMRKGKILFHKTLNIHFKINPVLKEQNTASQLPATYVYRIVKASPQEEAHAPISYTITY